MGKVVALEEQGIASDGGEGVEEAIAEVGTDNLNLLLDMSTSLMSTDWSLNCIFCGRNSSQVRPAV